MNLKALSNEELINLLNELEETDKTRSIDPNSKLKEFMDTLNPAYALIQAPVEIWKEAARRWQDNLNKVTWIGNTGVGVLRKN